MKAFFLMFVIIFFSACSADEESKSTNNLSDNSNVESDITNKLEIVSTASIINVHVSGSEGNYNFNVSVESFDKGCEYFADWWEVVREDGSLVYRRILFHSHVSEQPFTRAGGSVEIKEDDIVYIRAHMNLNGYGPNQFVGSVATGFSEVSNNISIDKSIENLNPQPNGCAF